MTTVMIRELRNSRILGLTCWTLNGIFPYPRGLNLASSSYRCKAEVAVANGILLFLHGGDQTSVTLPFPNPPAGASWSRVFALAPSTALVIDVRRAEEWKEGAGPSLPGLWDPLSSNLPTSRMELHVAVGAGRESVSSFTQNQELNPVALRNCWFGE
jgi:hypothetical protein